MPSVRSKKGAVQLPLIKLRASGADLLYYITTPKFAAQTIRKVAELNWSPAHVHILPELQLPERLHRLMVAAEADGRSAPFRRPLLRDQ
jgi:glycosyltransferase A (GT-A) superfamily protein (DUF2064 family)